MSASTRRSLLATLALLPLAARAQISRVPTITRLVRQFVDLEVSLLAAHKRGDKAAIDAMLADDFEMRVAHRPGTPVPRAEWLDALLRPPLPTGDAVLEQMAVHDQAGIMLVSFLLRPEGERAPVAQPLFVLDTWRQDAGRWRLAIRYAAPVMPGAALVPGDPNLPEAKKRI